MSNTRTMKRKKKKHADDSQGVFSTNGDLDGTVLLFAEKKKETKGRIEWKRAIIMGTNRKNKNARKKRKKMINKWWTSMRGPSGSFYFFYLHSQRNHDECIHFDPLNMQFILHDLFHHRYAFLLIIFFSFWSSWQHVVQNHSFYLH